MAIIIIIKCTDGAASDAPSFSNTHVVTGVHLRLAVVLQRHGDDVEADDESDDQVQVMAGTQSVDRQPDSAVRRIVRKLLGLWGEREGGKRTN